MQSVMIKMQRLQLLSMTFRGTWLDRNCMSDLEQSGESSPALSFKLTYWPVEADLDVGKVISESNLTHRVASNKVCFIQSEIYDSKTVLTPITSLMFG